MAYNIPEIRRARYARRPTAGDKIARALHEIADELRQLREAVIAMGHAPSTTGELVPDELDRVAARRAFERAGLRRVR